MHFNVSFGSLLLVCSEVYPYYLLVNINSHALRVFFVPGYDFFEIGIMLNV